MIKPWKIVALLLIGGAAYSVALPRDELATYQLKWGFVSVGTVEIRLSANLAENSDTFAATLSAKANGFMRRMHDFHTVIKSTFPAGVEYSLGYSRDEKAGEDLHETFIDVEGGEARYSKNGDLRNPVRLLGMTQDPLSIVFAFRSGAVPFEVGEYQAWVTDGKVVELADFTISGPETIKTAAGKFETLRVTADFKGVRAIFARPEGALIDVWLTNDDRRIPVKLISEATIGSFRSELRAYEGDDAVSEE